MAHKLAQPTLPAQFWLVLLGGSFYQYSETQSLAEQLTTIIDSLSSLDAAAVRKALARGFNEKEILQDFQEKISSWVEAFLEFVAQHTVSDSAKSSFVKSALEHTGIKNKERQQTFARLLNQHKALTPELLKALERDRSFTKSEIADLHTSFQLVDLTRGDFSVVEAIRADRDAAANAALARASAKEESEEIWAIQEQQMITNAKIITGAQMFQTLGGAGEVEDVGEEATVAGAARQMIPVLSP